MPFNNSTDQLLNCGARFSQDCRLLLRCFQRRLLLVGGRLRGRSCIAYSHEPLTVRACQRHAIRITPHKATAAVWGRGTLRGTACRRHATETMLQWTPSFCSDEGAGGMTGIVGGDASSVVSRCHASSVFSCCDARSVASYPGTPRPPPALLPFCQRQQHRIVYSIRWLMACPRRRYCLSTEVAH